MKILLFFVMLYCHIIDDYKLQGILANMKQSQWWEENAPNTLYKNDYKIALLEHAFSWSFTISLPFLYIAITQQNISLAIFLGISYIINTIIHAYVDNLKANKHKINLIQDQCLHFLQIYWTWFIGTLFF